MTELRELSAENVFSADDMKVEPVDVPEWGGRIYVRRLTGRERDEFEQLMNDRRAGKILKVQGVITKIVALAACNAAGNKLFTGGDAEAKLDEKACAPLMRVFDAALKISGMRDDDIQNLTEGLE
jgi:hypothetical protein